MAIATHHLTSRGGRPDNEDAIREVAGDGFTLLVLADGLGGHGDGAMAARLCVDTVAETFVCAPGLSDQDLQAVVSAADRSVAALRLAEGKPAESIRTTLALLAVYNDTARWAHVGDSRVYWFRDNSLMHRTRDHSVAELVAGLEDSSIAARQIGTGCSEWSALARLFNDIGDGHGIAAFGRKWFGYLRQTQPRGRPKGGDRGRRTMAMVQCENRHMYDNRKHVYCPYCPVPGLKNPRVERTQAASLNQSASGVDSTEPAFPPRGADPVRPAGNPNRSGVANVTVGVFQRHSEGVNPVTGWIVCIKGVNKGRDYRLHSDRNMIGRAPNMDVCIEGDETISREDHCQIAFSPRSRAFTLLPGTGRNLIYLNGEDVFEARPLNPYDRIDLGESGFMFIPFCGDRFMWARADHPVDNTTPPSPPSGGPPPRRPGTIVG